MTKGKKGQDVPFLKLLPPLPAQPPEQEAPPEVQAVARRIQAARAADRSRTRTRRDSETAEEAQFNLEKSSRLLAAAGITTSPDKELLRLLYTTANEIKQLSPWLRPFCRQILGLRLAGREEPVFVTLVDLADNRSLMIYPDMDAYWRLNTCLELPDGAERQRALLVRFVNREEISDWERAILKDLELRFRGRKQWINFTSVMSPFCPRSFNQEEGLLMSAVLKLLHTIWQLPEPTQLQPQEGEMLWYDEAGPSQGWQLRPLPPPPAQTEAALIDEMLAHRLRKQPKSPLRVLLGCAYLEAPVRDQSQDIYYHPLALMMVEESSGQIMDLRFLSPVDDIVKHLSQMFFDLVERVGRPQRLLYQTDQARFALANLSRRVGVNLVRQDSLPGFERAFRELNNKLSRE